jgi:hypothetical protein
MTVPRRGILSVPCQGSFCGLKEPRAGMQFEEQAPDMQSREIETIIEI